MRSWLGSTLGESPIELSAAGILASIFTPLANARIPIFATSTFDTNCVLIKQEQIYEAKRVLKASGHEVS